VDVDPVDDRPLDQEQQRIRERIMRDDDEALPPASVIIFSGGGYQGFWRQRKPIMINCNEAAAEDAELYNVQIAKLRGGDKCHNADRIMRLPGTVNWPNAKKRERGQVPVVAELIRANWDVVYDIDQFLKAPPVKGASSSSSRGGAAVQVDMGNVKRIALDALETDPVLSKIEQRAKVAIVQGLDPEQPLTGGNTRSDWLWFVACAMVRADVDDTTMFSIITDPDLKISEHVLAAGNAKAVHRCAMRTIERAHEFAINPWLGELNCKYALVESIGGKTRIMRRRYDYALGHDDIEFLQKDGFLATYSNRFIEMPKTDNTGKTVGIIQIPVGKWWLAHPQRLTYSEVTFAPGIDMPEDVFNRWQGFSCDPKPGDCSLYLNHVRDNICRGNEEHYDYVIRWMARTVQRPDRQAEVALVLRGRKGIGKGEFVRHYGRLFGAHFKYVANPKHLTGNFNAVLLDAKLVFADECFVKGDKEHEAGQKALITNATIRVEPKGIDTLEVRNFVALIMATNANWSVSVTEDERRYLALDVGEAQRKNRAYFEAIDQQMKSGGYAALLHHLLNEVDLSGWDHTNVPMTDEMRRQQKNSLSDINRWWLGVIEDGYFECDTWKGKMERPAKKPLYDMIRAACPKQAFTDTDLAEFMQARGAKKVQGKGGTGLFWAFPPLAACRQAWLEDHPSSEKPSWTPRTVWGGPEVM
jgi:hypothetical protein